MYLWHVFQQLVVQAPDREGPYTEQSPPQWSKINTNTTLHTVEVQMYMYSRLGNKMYHVIVLWLDYG